MALMDALTVLYRGPLASCNYACPYCPFAKQRDSRSDLARDRSALRRFTTWVTTRDEATAVFFTPWGEALVRPWYQEAMVEMSRAPRVARVAIQTNLHARLTFLEKGDPSRIGLWCTYHPGEVRFERFVSQCFALERLGVEFSVGVVGLREHFEEIERLRAALPRERYVWVNAYKREPGYYSTGDVERLTRIDPLFPINNQSYPSLGKSCRTGHRVISVDGEGDVRRCHFVPEVLGNIYEQDITPRLRRRPCPNGSCRCHIGYVHMDGLALHEIYGNGILERVPTTTHVSRIGR